MVNQDIKQQLESLFLDTNIAHLRCLEALKYSLENCSSFEEINGVISVVDNYITKAALIVAQNS